MSARIRKSGRRNASSVSIYNVPGESVLDNLLSEGNRAYNVLRLAGNVADTETITIGTQVFEIEQINTDTNKNTANVDASAMNATDNPVRFSMEDADHGLALGNLIRVDNEIMRLVSVSGAVLMAARAKCGTVAATHVKNSDVYKGNGFTATRTPIGIGATVTAAVASLAIPAVINELGTAGYTATRVSDNIIFLVSDTVGVKTTATTETLGTANNAWLCGATVKGGATAGPRKMQVFTRVVDAAEATLALVYVPLDWAPSAVIVQVKTVTTGLIKAWDGQWAYAAGPPKRLVIDNTGDVDWIAGDTITVLAFE
jgi:hypothetical protein